MFAVYKGFVGDTLDAWYCLMTVSLNSLHGIFRGPASLSCDNDATDPNPLDQMGNGSWA